LVLLPDVHPAVICIRRLLCSLPKFNVNSPVPYENKDLLMLHKENLNLVTNYLCKLQLPIPNNFNISYQHPNRLNILEDSKYESLSFHHPFRRLKRLLEVFNLILLPADKTRILIILEESTLQNELCIHLQDTDTYEQIPPEIHSSYMNIQLQSIQDAVIYYRDPKLLPLKPSMRYIYFLPKIHKEFSEWRTMFHPKMRPIVSDTGSVTYHLARRLLPTLC
jgi:hypothetical protein